MKKVNKKLKLGSYTIHDNSLPYIIAEIGVNHECSITLAKKMIDQAAQNGAHAVKFQSYKADKIASKYSPSYWDTREEKSTSQYNLFKKYDKFEIDDFKKLKKYCDKKKIDFLSTPFDNDVVDKLSPLVPLFKVASADITNLPLLKKVARTKKPIVLSTGASNLEEIKFSYNFLKKNGAKEIIILHCILSYPTKHMDANLKMITCLKNEFPDNFIGYSDHTKPDDDMSSVISSYLLGARVIEKHFTHNKKLKGNDHYHSMDKNDLKKMIIKLKNAQTLIGTEKIKKCIKVEKKSRINARRSIYANKFIKKGHKIKLSDLICKRPGSGLSPIKIYKIIGKKAKQNIQKDSLISANNY